jgi:LPS-assembly protein
MGNTNKRGFNAGVDGIYDYRQKQLWITAQVTYNTDCCGLSAQYRQSVLANPTGGIVIDHTEAISFSVANIGAVGTLSKQARLF